MILDTKLDVHRTKSDIDESTGGSTKGDAEKHKSGKLLNENKSTKYKEEKGNADKYKNKGDHGEEVHTHGGKKKEATYKKGDKHKKYKTKKVRCQLYFNL